MAALCLALASAARADEVVTRPFVGVVHVARTETSPRPLRMHIIDIDLSAQGLHLRVTPPRGRLETVKQTTLQYLVEQRAQIAINAHFFEPWPAPEPDDGAVDLVGLAASDGRVYSAFTAEPPKPQAIRPDVPAINVGPDNRASVVHRNPQDPSGRSVVEPLALYNAVAGSEQIVTGGAVTVGPSDWNRQLNPRTAIGLTGSGHLILFTVDGRQSGMSEGMSVGEVAEFLVQHYGVVDALNMDGGGSTTLAMADLEPRVVNTPVGISNTPGTLRAVGSNLAIFAQAAEVAAVPSPAPATTGQATEWIVGIALVAGLAIAAWFVVRRKRPHPPAGRRFWRTADR